MRSIGLNVRIEFGFGRILVSMLLFIFVLAWLAKQLWCWPFHVVLVTLTVVILLMVLLWSTLVIFLRHRLPISTDTRTFMSINIRAHVYQHVYWDEYLVRLLILELAQIFITTRMSVLAW